MDSIRQDVRQALRMLGKTPAFTLAIAVTLGLGIGANAAVFSVVNVLLLRPLPVADADNLYVLSVSHQDNEDPHQVSWSDYVDYRDRSGVFSDLAAYQIGFVGLRTGDRADRIAAAYVTGNFFSMLGLTPGLGRLIGPSEGRAYGADPVVVLGRSYWKKRFNADPAIAGQRVLVNGQPFTVAGVVPEHFYGVYALVEFDAYMPFGMIFPESGYRTLIDKRDDHELRVLGRLKPGISAAQAQAALDVFGRQLEQQYPDTNKTVRPRLFAERLARPEPNSANSNPLAAGVFMLLVGFVLLVACVNVVNLLLVRASARQRELAVRAALGARRGRLVRQLLTESLILSAAGAVTGAIVGRWISGLLAGITLPADLPIRFDLSFDWRVFTYIGIVAAGSGIAVGLVPSLRASRTDLNEVLRQGGRSLADSRARQRVRGVLTVAQVAVSLVLLVAAGLFVRSVQRARAMDLGFDPAQVLNLSMDVSQQGMDEARGRAFYRQVEDRIRALPGVELTSYAYSVPFGYYSSGDYVEAEGQPVAKDQRKPQAGSNFVGPDYFRAMRIPIVAGRAFSTADDERGQNVAIVNELMARRLWPGQDPLGKRFHVQGRPSDWLTVVGLTRTGHYGYIFEDPRMYFYAPIAQQYRPLRVLQVRTTGAPELLAPAAEREIRALNPDLPVYDVRSMARTLDGPNGFFLLQMGAMFGAGLGLLGLALALVGIYGVVSYAASQRTQEIGVRMALGATRRDILRLVVGQGLVLVAIGVAIGLAGALGVSRLLGNLLFGVSASDPLTFVAVPIALATMALAASFFPAYQASRIAPMTALNRD